MHSDSQMIDGHPFRLLRHERIALDSMHERAVTFVEEAKQRRSVRSFSSDAVPLDLIEAAVEAAATAPSGAHLQPWHFVIVGDPAVRKRLRAAAETEERAFYAERATDAWKEALAPLGTDEVKHHITDAPWVVVMFRERYRIGPDGKHERNYYSAESCGIAAGMFITAVHHMGLATLPHTPSPMGFLSEVLERPSNEQPFLLLPVGYPADDAMVPDIHRRPLNEVLSIV